jgi:hypothetical protein
MQFLSAAMALHVNQSCRQMTRLIFEVNLKHIEDNFPAHRFKNAFQRDLSRSKRCGSSEEAAFFCRGQGNSGKYYTALSKLKM